MAPILPVHTGEEDKQQSLILRRSPHLRLFERRGIAAVARRQLADKPQILLLSGRRQRAQPERLGEALHRFRIQRAAWLRATPQGGRMRGLCSCRIGCRHGASSLARRLTPAHLRPRDLKLTQHRRSPRPRSGLVQQAARANADSWHVGCGAAFGASCRRGSPVTLGKK